jgi:hypothetical protein
MILPQRLFSQPKIAQMIFESLENVLEYSSNEDESVTNATPTSINISIAREAVQNPILKPKLLRPSIFELPSGSLNIGKVGISSATSSRAGSGASTPTGEPSARGPQGSSSVGTGTNFEEEYNENCLKVRIFKLIFLLNLIHRRPHTMFYTTFFTISIILHHPMDPLC